MLFRSLAVSFSFDVTILKERGVFAGEHVDRPRGAVEGAGLVGARYISCGRSCSRGACVSADTKGGAGPRKSFLDLEVRALPWPMTCVDSVE